jgi:hypothetical protein
MAELFEAVFGILGMVMESLADDIERTFTKKSKRQKVTESSVTR